MKTMKRRDWIILGILGALLYILMCWAVYTYFTTRYTGGNDFYSRWAGARALLLEDRDPYSLEVTKEIQLVKGIDPALEGKGSFAYPLPIIFLFLPLSYISYTWALAVWMVTLIWITVAIVVLLLQFFSWKPGLWVMALLILATLFLYPLTRSILLGQFTLHVTLFIILTLWMLQHGRDGWAGFFLSLTIVKPQMVVMIVPWFVVWALGQKRWRLIGGFLGGGVALLALSLPLFPRWPLAFLEDIQRYAPVAGGKNPLVVLGDQIIVGAGPLFRWSLTFVTLVMTGWKCWVGFRSNGEPFLRATYWIITSSLLVMFQTGTTNQVLLLIPLYDWLFRLSRAKFGGWWVTFMLSLLIILPWIAFVNTIQGDAESALMFFPLPVLSLIILVSLDIFTWWSKRPLPAIAAVTPDL